MKTGKTKLLTVLCFPVLLLVFACCLSAGAKAAHYLIDDSAFTTRHTHDPSMLQSGWNFDNRGGIPKLTDDGPYELNDVSVDFGTALIRPITVQTGGKITLEGAISILSGGNGFYYEFLGTNGASVYRLITEGGFFNVIANGVKTQLSLDALPGDYSFRITLDLDAKTSRTVINSISHGSHALSQSAVNINKLILGTTAQDVLYVIPSPVRLYCDYSVNETFSYASTGSMPYGWTRTLTGSSAASVLSNEMQLSLSGSGNATVQKTFDAVSGKICMETLFLLPALADGASFRLMSGNTIGVSVNTQNNKIFSGATELRDYYLANMWYILRIEADTAAKTALIKINGKTLGTVNFENNVNSFDRIRICLAGNSAAALRFDDVSVFSIPAVADYVPQPIKPAKSFECYVGVNVCSLWKNGEHYGWDNISAFDEIKPSLGYYDDFLPEVSDWEIKYMVEHGIDYQSFCWYSSQSDAPIKTTVISGALHKGFMNAKYSDMMKFGLLWEAANAARPASSFAFRNYFVPYWVEYFFTDPRYIVIDNKPVITVFGYNHLVNEFGSAANVASELQYVRNVCQGLGFSGAIFLACSGSTSASELQIIADCGFDGIQAYNWGKNGYDPDYTKDVINTQYNHGIIHVVPTVSTGFNNIGWGGDRSPNMSADDFGSMMTWVKNTALPRNPAGTWKSKLVMLSTWNEYGEGTYLMPSGLNGFDYLDKIRAAFTANPAHSDIVPTENQKKRLGYLYPQDRSIIRPLQIGDTSYPPDVLHSWDFALNRAVSNEWNYINMASPVVTGGAIRATPTNIDPILQMKNDLNLDISRVRYVKVRVKSVKGNTLQLFYITQADQTWDEPKSVSIPVFSSEMTEYFLPVYTKSSWSGTLKKLRVDPLNSVNEFTVESISLMYDLTNVCQSWDFVIGGAVSDQWNYINMSAPVVAGGAVSSTATNNDPILLLKSGMNLDISNVPYVKVRASGPAGCMLQMYYITAADGTWNEAKSISTQINGNGVIDYYLPVHTKPTWTGTLKKIRIDPINSAGGFSVESVTLLHTEHPIQLIINGEQIPLRRNPDIRNGHYMIPILPETGILNYFNAYHEWTKSTGFLHLAANNNSVNFVMGSPFASIGGISTYLDCTPYLFDGVPMVPIDALVSAFGYDMQINGNTIEITTPWKIFYEILRGDTGNCWEFKLTGFSEGWTYGHVAPDYNVPDTIGGTAVLTGGGTYDPILYSPDLDIQKGAYSKIVVGMSHDFTTVSSGTAKVFYITSDTNGWDAGRCIVGTPAVAPKSSAGNFIEYTFSLSAVSGTLTRIRFDPFDAQGSFHVDYIRFE